MRGLLRLVIRDVGGEGVEDVLHTVVLSSLLPVGVVVGVGPRVLVQDQVDEDAVGAAGGRTRRPFLPIDSKN